MLDSQNIYLRIYDPQKILSTKSRVKILIRFSIKALNCSFEEIQLQQKSSLLTTQPTQKDLIPLK